LGCGINIENAITIGLLPDMPRDKFMPIGNSSLGGAEMILLDRGLIGRIEGLLPMITYREMNENQDLMNVLQGALFIPHTEPDLLKG
ncbi:MAG: putative metal-binding protein, partial [Bacteroidetes bacterium]|nr:putative metal-binding protein [Bacteroidota bacterium]